MRAKYVYGKFQHAYTYSYVLKMRPANVLWRILIPDIPVCSMCALPLRYPAETRSIANCTLCRVTLHLDCMGATEGDEYGPYACCIPCMVEYEDGTVL